jgi:hypothetical protein
MKDQPRPRKLVIILAILFMVAALVAGALLRVNHEGAKNAFGQVTMSRQASAYYESAAKDLEAYLRRRGFEPTAEKDSWEVADEAAALGQVTRYAGHVADSPAFHVLVRLTDPRTQMSGLDVKLHWRIRCSRWKIDCILATFDHFRNDLNEWWIAYRREHPLQLAQPKPEA